MKFQAAQAVKVIDETLERHGQVGTVIAEDETGEIAVKMDLDEVVETYHPDSLGTL